MTTTSGFSACGHGHGLPPVICFPDNREVGLGFDHHAQTGANQGVVVGKQDAGLLHALPPAGKGRSAVTVAPLSGLEIPR